MNYNIQDNYANNWIYIKIIEIYPDYSGYNLYQFNSFDLEGFIPKMPISLFTYNGFILYTSTAISLDQIYNSEDEINDYSILMIFGYPNGTDSTIDISDFLFDDVGNPSPSNDFYDFLITNCTIENNIGYNQEDRIKLVSIPEEIIITEVPVDGNIDNSINITNNSFIYPRYTGKNYIFKQKNDLIKTSEYYYIDYQYIVQGTDGQSLFGRTNRLQFKLCHNYCGDVMN